MHIIIVIRSILFVAAYFLLLHGPVEVTTARGVVIIGATDDLMWPTRGRVLGNCELYQPCPETTTVKVQG